MEVKIIAYALIGIFLGPVASIAITPIFCLLRKIFFVPFICENLREKAKKNGHVVQATLQKYHTLNDSTEFGPVTTMREMGTYTYVVNGKEYKYQHITARGLPDTLTLYYIKNLEKPPLAGIWVTGKRHGLSFI